MSTHKLFKKHFGSQIAVDLKHPNMESFFEELNEECLQEDKHKKCNVQPVSDSLHIDFAVYLTGHDREIIEQMYNDWRQ